MYRCTGKSTIPPVGSISRQCGTEGEWRNVNATTCSSAEFFKIQMLVSNVYLHNNIILYVKIMKVYITDTYS